LLFSTASVNFYSFSAITQLGNRKGIQPVNILQVKVKGKGSGFI